MTNGTFEFYWHSLAPSFHLARSWNEMLLHRKFSTMTNSTRHRSYVFLRGNLQNHGILTVSI